jgi:hypothetical protein
VRQLVLDVECFPNYFLIMFTDATGKYKAFEQYTGHPLDIVGVLKVLINPGVEIITFNGNGYDMPVIMLALTGADNMDLHEATVDLIERGVRPWDFYRNNKVTQIQVNHIDLIEVAPGMASLKIYGGRLHGKRMQDLPYPPKSIISEKQRPVVRQYCRNDCIETFGLLKELTPQIELRRVMSAQYGVDLRSKSDAQIAEAVLKTEVERITGERVTKKEVRYKSFKYIPPKYVRFITEGLQHVFNTICDAEFVVKDTGHVQMPVEIEKMTIEVGGNTFKIGIGGLHSQESCVTHYADANTSLIDRDVRSYYPNLMLNMGMYPPALGPDFIDVYRNILRERLVAKEKGDKVKDAALKITLNGTFGKTSNKYSVLYNPEFMIRTTITGQLSLLMLIELLEHKGIKVLSANTDGVVMRCRKDQEKLLAKIIAVWEQVTNLETEETRYRQIHARDVNNYIAITTDGKLKIKGVYGDARINKNPQNEICAEAVVAYVKDGTPIEETIQQCGDIRKFITVRTVKGGAYKQGYELGKAIRWYYANGIDGVITYRTNGNTVPRTEGAKPVMELPDEFPTDINYAWYIAEADSMLKDMGAIEKPSTEKIPRRNCKAWHELVEAGKIRENHKGKWEWV